MQDINYQIEILKITRQNFLDLINKFDIDQLNHIPEGFNNNLIWNYGHNIVTQQLLCYALSGNEMYVPNDIVTKYRKGSKPSDFVGQEEVDYLKGQTFELIDQFEKDYNSGMFKGYKEYTTSFNITLKSVENGFAFNNVHEGMHFGVALSLRKLI